MRTTRKLPPVLVVAVCSSMVATWVVARTATTYTVDSYFYLGRARAMARLEGWSASFGGFDRKFFPGYPFALTPFVALFGDAAYVLLNIAAVAISAVLAWRLGRRLGMSDGAATAGAVLGCTAPVVIQWAALPMAEPVAAALVTGFLLAWVRARESARLSDALIAGLLLGTACVTRAEAAPLVALLLPGAIRPATRRTRGAAMAGAALFPLLFVGSLAAHRSSGASITRYASEWRTDLPTCATAVERLLYHLSAVYDLRFAGALPSVATVAMNAMRCATVVAVLFVVMRRDRRARLVLAAPVIAGAAIHALWWYQYERFAVAWAPEVGLLVAWWWSDINRRYDAVVAARFVSRALLGACACLSIACGIASGRAHNSELAAQSATPHARALAERIHADARCSPGVITHPDPELAYLIDRPVWFAGALPNFVDSDVPPNGLAQFAKAHHARCVAPNARPDRWLSSWGVPQECASEITGPPWLIVLSPERLHGCHSVTEEPLP